MQADTIQSNALAHDVPARWSAMIKMRVYIVVYINIIQQ